MFPNDTDRIIPRKTFSHKIPSIIQILFSIGFVFIFFLAPILLPDQQGILYDRRDFLLPAILIAYFVIYLGITIFQSWQVRKNWAALAEDMNFTYTPSGRDQNMSISGRYRSHQFEVIQFTEKRGRSQVHYTNFAIPLNSTVSTTLNIRARSLSDFNRDITGDTEIDRKLTFSSNSQQLLDNLLRTRSIRQGLLQLKETNRKMYLDMDKTTLRLTLRGQIGDQEYIQAALTYLVELAGAIERFEQIGR